MKLTVNVARNTCFIFYMFLAATVCAQGHSITINAAVAFIAFLH
jgi:hypothetical protein